MSRRISVTLCVGWMLLILLQSFNPAPVSAANETVNDYSLLPPFVSAGVPPLVMLVMGRDHKLFYQAYNDASDLDGDGILDVGYKPGTQFANGHATNGIDYYGYFDSYKCYTYSTTNGRFEPTSTTTNKTCSGSSEWSGDWLNYVTMSRMDCLRKVLYGGKRSTDTADTTVLQRAYIPRDAHTWGKEYESVSRDGYDIRNYTPLDLPACGTRHLFANTTLAENGDPKLRVLPNNPHRIWEWTATEAPEAKDDSSITVTSSTQYTGSPANHAEFQTLVDTYGNSCHLQGSQAPPNGMIDGGDAADANPFGAGSYYLDIFTGKLLVTNAGSYTFAVDGDDAEELLIDGIVVAGYYGAHGRCTCQDHTGTITLTAGEHTVEFRHQEASGAEYWYLWWKGPDSNNAWQKVPAAHFSGLVHAFYNVQSTVTSTITDYIVRVLVGVSSMPEPNCKRYPHGDYKPVGILQKNGESGRMYFGLITGSYTKNTSGGVLRKNIGPITDEINSDDGHFTYDPNTASTKGIIGTIDSLRIIGYSYSTWHYDCGWIATRPINEGECRMWGNPIGEMMYEALRYFSATSTTTYTSEFHYDFSNATLDDNILKLPEPAWSAPYVTYSHCAKPFMVTISDINPSFDSDQLPGSYFNKVDGSSFSGSSLNRPDGNFDAMGLANTISTYEVIAGSHYIGQSGTTVDSSCAPKDVADFSHIRGLCPEDPTKQGSYYSAAAAYYGRKTDINDAEGDQNVVTYTVGLASPLPRIAIPVSGKTITLVPFAKTCGNFGGSSAKGDFQPTNQIVNFFVEEITPTYGRFRINFEDVEQGADHDMDAIVHYEYQVTGGKVYITLTSEYASGSYLQHMGYIISGTTADGTYLEVKDTDNATDNDYYLDTPPGSPPPPSNTWNDGNPLPLTTTRMFSPATSGAAATLLENPLWYAAKWGGYEENPLDSNDIPDKRAEWDKDNDGVPDTYFYVTNPLKLEEQLSKSFADILRRTASGTAASVISSSRSGEGAIYQAVFYTEYKDGLGNKVNWVGDLHSLFVDSYGNMREDTNGNHQLDVDEDYFIEFSSTSPGTILKYKDLNKNSRIDPDERLSPISVNTLRGCSSTEMAEAVGSRQCVAYIWSADSWLNEIPSSDVTNQRTPYVGTTSGQIQNRRYITTFVDANQNMIPDANEIVPFTDTETSIYPYIHDYSPYAAPAYIEPYRAGYSVAANKAVFDDFLLHQNQRVIDFIRGQDQGAYTASSYTIPAFRSRQVDYDSDDVAETWRLGDIVFSTPTIVATPSEDFDMLYRDLSYVDFYRKYRMRRTVVYAGGNDGMLHAFNGGFFDSSKQKFWKKYPFPDSDADDLGPALGAEMWAYVPYNLLPHLYWLTDPNYNEQVHVSYVDLKPRIFDAKIFPQTGDTTHPNGWGTLLVCGMRFGGGKIHADMDKTDGLTRPAGSTDAHPDRTMSSAYIIMDITDPEAPPTLLAEVTTDTLGFTTGFPTVVTLKNTTGTDPNKWYLVFGSGPIDYSATSFSSYSTALAEASSNQSGKLFVLDLKALTTDPKKVVSLGTNNAFSDGLHPYLALDNNSFVSDPVTVDFNLDYKADAVYYGTVSGSYAAKGWGGKLNRLIIKNNTDPAAWLNRTLIDLTDTGSFTETTGGTTTTIHYGQPIVSAPTIGLEPDKDHNGGTQTCYKRWVFFGTGRFFNRSDVSNVTASQQQTYYGVKEPGDGTDPNACLSWQWEDSVLGKVSRNQLLDVSHATVYEGGNTVTGVAGGNTDFTTLQGMVQKGWYIDFQTTMERNLGQATLLGDVLTFTSYVPSADVCQFEGNSNLYATYYTTGTAYTSPIVGMGAGTIPEGTEQKHEVLRQNPLGAGLTMTPNLHTGAEEGSVVFVQTSTGTISETPEENPGVTKSGKTSWREMHH